MMRIDWRVGLARMFLPLLALAATACDDTFFKPDPEIDNPGSPVFSNSTKAASAWNGSGTEAKPYLINNAEGLKKLLDDVNGAREDNEKYRYYDTYFRLTKDIEITVDEWIPIGCADTCYFSGYFDGNGKTISGVLTSGNYSRFGLFGYLNSGGTVTNLTLSVEVTNTYNGSEPVYTGALAGISRSSAKIQNCHVSGSVKGGTSTSNNCYTGGLVGYLYKNGFRDCTVSDMTVVGGKTSGDQVRNLTAGVAGYLSDADLRNCRTSRVTVTGGEGNYCYTGGLAGDSYNGNIRSCDISDTQITGGSAYIEDVTGGVAGMNNKVITACSLLSGTVNGGTASVNSYTGGIAGYNSGAIHMCATAMLVTGGTATTTATGGLAGENSGTELYGCNANTGTVDGTAASSASPDNRVGGGDAVNEAAHTEPNT